MSTPGIDDDIDIDDIEEEEPPQPPAPPPDTELTPEAKQIAELQAQLKESNARGGGIEQLVELGKQFLANQNRPAPPAPVDRSADVDAFGAELQNAIISGKPGDAATLFVQAVDKISTNRVNEALQKAGTPIAEKAGEFALQTFLAHKAGEMGVNGEKTHKLIAKDFKMDANERAWLATASADAAATYLENKYRQAAGDVLLRSSRNAKPKNIDGGAGGGGGGSVPAFPNLNARQSRQMDKLAESYWPDPKVRAEKLKLVAANLAEGA